MPDGEIRRGVVFIKELVPSSTIAYVAKAVYHEPYERWDIRHSNDLESGFEYTWSKGESKNSLGVLIESGEHDLYEGSHEQFIMEHYWGYTRLRTNATAEYEVRHPVWSYQMISDLEVDCDFSAVYGDHFDFLGNIQPDSRFFSRGSEISVYSKSRFRVQDF